MIKKWTKVGFELFNREMKSEKMKKIGSFRKTLMKWDHSFYQKFLHAFGLLSAIFHILFYFILSDLVGYKESFFLRFLTSVGLGLFIFLPKEKPLKTWQKFYIEFVYALALPIIFTYSLLINDANIYWFSSLVFCGLLYGLLSQQIIGFFSLILTFSLMTVGYKILYGLPPEVLKLSLLAYLVCLTLYVLSAVIRTIFQMSFEIRVKLYAEQAKMEQIKKNFQKLKTREEIILRFVRPSLLTELALGKNPLVYPPQKITTSVLFIDMRNYTSLSETGDQNENYKILNDYFSIINSAVFRNDGEVDKIMGDAVMATFSKPEKCLTACDEMWRELSEANRIRYLKGLPLVRFGTGISYGETLSANFGSEQKLDRTIVGDIVNIGSRLENKTREYNVDLLATDEFMQANKEFKHSRVIDQIVVKGKLIPVLAHEIFSHNHSDVIEQKMSTKDDLRKIIDLKNCGQCSEAIDLLNLLIKKCPRHRYFNGEMMDPALLVIKNKIVELAKLQEVAKKEKVS